MPVAEQGDDLLLGHPDLQAGPRRIFWGVGCRTGADSDRERADDRVGKAGTAGKSPSHVKTTSPFPPAADGQEDLAVHHGNRRNSPCRFRQTTVLLAIPNAPASMDWVGGPTSASLPARSSRA